MPQASSVSMINDPATDAKVTQLQQQLQALEQSLAELKANNSTTKERPTAKKVQPARKNSVSSELKLNYNKIYDVLAKASKEDLRQFGQVWGDRKSVV